MFQSDVLPARLASLIKYLSRRRDLRVAPPLAENYSCSHPPGGSFARLPRPTKLTLGKARNPREAILEATEQVTLIGSQGAGACAVQDSVVGQQVARLGAYILLDVSLDHERRDMLAHLHKEVGTLTSFRVLNVDDPSQSHTYNPLVRGTAKAVAARILSALINPAYGNGRITDAEFAAAVELVSVLVQALRDRDGVAQFDGLHVALNSVEGFGALVSSHRIHPTTRTELAMRFDAFRTDDAQGYDLDKIREPLARFLRMLRSFATGQIGQVLNVAKPEIDLLEVLNTRKGLFVMLPTMGKDDVALALGRLVLADLGDTLEEKKVLARNPEQPPALIVTVETPCLSTGKLFETFAAAKAAGVGVLAGVGAVNNLGCLSPMDQNALLHNRATKVFFRTYASDTPEVLRDFGHTLAQAGASRALPNLLAGLGTAPAGEGFISRGSELTHLGVWPQVEVHGSFEHYRVPQRQLAPDTAVRDALSVGAAE